MANAGHIRKRPPCWSRTMSCPRTGAAFPTAPPRDAYDRFDADAILDFITID